MKKRSFWLVAVIAIVIGGMALAMHFKAADILAAPSVCAPISITIDRANSVHGLKNGKLFAYIDLAEMAPALACHSDADITAKLTPVLEARVKDWWQEERLSKATKGEVDIITILDKDEYARSNFNSALIHGKMEFTREAGQIKALPSKLTFDNMRAALAKKH